MDTVAVTDCGGVVVSVGQFVALTDIATRVPLNLKGTHPITHLFNNTPYLHHRYFGIRDLSGASPSSSPAVTLEPVISAQKGAPALLEQTVPVPAMPNSPASAYLRVARLTLAGQGT